MPFEYTLPLTGAGVQTLPYLASTATTLSGITGTLNLSAVTTLTDTLSFGAGRGTKFTLNVTARPAAGAVTLSATSTDIFLTVPNSRGGTTIYGYIDSSTLNGTTSAYTANIKFRDMDYLATTLALSGSRNNCVFVSSATQIDNPFFVRIGVSSITTVNSGLSTLNRYYRTISRHTRLVQGEY